MVLCLVLILLITVYLSITNVFSIVESTRIIKMVQVKNQSARYLKWPVLLWFTSLFSGKMALVKYWGQWILVMPPIFTITRPMLRTSCLLISSLELNFPITIWNIFIFGVILLMSWMPHFNKVVNSQNGSHNIVLGYFLDLVQTILVMFYDPQPSYWPYLPTISCYILLLFSSHSSIFLPRKNLLLSVMNVISMIFPT